MELISLKEYAKLKNISYEAVRQQVVRYKKELTGHVIVDGKQQFLDEEAVAFLDSKRQKNPVVIIQQDKDEMIKALEDEVKALLAKTAQQADRISELAQWKADNAVAIAEANHRNLLLENKEQEVKLLEGFIADAKEEIEVQKAQNVDLRAEVDRLKDLVAQEHKTAQEASEELTAQKEENEELKSRKWYQLLFKR